MEPFALDMIDPKSIWIIEDESLDDLLQLRTQHGNPSGTLVFDTPDMLTPHWIRLIRNQIRSPSDEDESLDYLSWLNTQPDDLSGTLVFDTPNMLTSQLPPETSGPGVTSVADPRSFKSMLGILKDET